MANPRTTIQWIAAAALVASLAGSSSARAQSDMTVGVARGSGISAPASAARDIDADGIAVDQRPAFRDYIAQENVPTYTVPDRVIVGGTLPDAGVTYYDVPQSYSATPYRYTVVNGQTILVEPRTRRIVQVID